ncbi:MAG: RNA polymerase sigma-70 factor [Bacteroidetes bacterium]|nr:RNA polymerase sigma-70 factor [Bacteroidota bacterium]
MHNPGSDIEHELLQRIARGDRVAFNKLYTRYLDNLYRYVFLFTRSAEISEEIVQDVFIRLWESRDLLADVHSFQPYLLRAAKNKIMDDRRRRQVRRRALEGLRAQSAEQPLTPGDAFDYKAYYLLVQEAIGQLTPRRQEVFRLSTEKGLSYDEIAAQLQISKSAVKKQLYEAYDSVQQYLARHGGLSFLLVLLAAAPRL